MKLPLRSHLLPLFSIGAGGLGFALRLWLFSTVDEKGLLPAGHFADTALYILTALVLGFLFLATRQVPKCPMSKNTARYFCSASYLLGGSGLLISGVASLSSGNTRLAMLATVACGIGTVVMVCMAVLKVRGQQLPYWQPAILTVVLMLCTVAQCQIWGAEPELQVYFFPLLASVFLILSAYHKTKLAAQQGNANLLLFFSQGALFLCCLCLNAPQWPLYFGMLFWAAAQRYPCILMKKEA